MISASTLERLAALSLSTEQMSGVLSILAEQERADEQRRAKQRTRTASFRSRNVTPTLQERDCNGDNPSPKEIPPTPPKEITPSPEPIGSVSLSARETDLDFVEFWEAYPHKVGKPAARRAFSSALFRAGGLHSLLTGLARYKSDKPPDRQWLNPATFLNQDRFADEPAANPVPAAKVLPHDTIFSALARAASRGSGAGGGPPGSDGSTEIAGLADAPYRGGSSAAAGSALAVTRPGGDGSGVSQAACVLPFAGAVRYAR